MKLPKEYNLYKHNEYGDELYNNVCALIEAHKNDYTLSEICYQNLSLLKSIHAKILHLELALDEIIKLSEERI